MPDLGLPVLSPNALFHRRYRVVRCLKAGGMGAVYEVVDERTDNRRALKVMLPGVVEDPDMRARFAQEARITGSLESEHIVDTVDADIDEETATPFLVMELLRGEDLAGVLRKRGRLSPREVVSYLFQIALALDKTHAAGIVHRDLKPENLFLTRRDDGSPCVKILDFGIAKMMAQRGRDPTTRALGTPLYMAPEQAGGRPAVSPGTDIYALGHIAFTLLSGEPYWELEWSTSETLLAFFTEVARGVREPASARASSRGVDLPSAFDEWFLEATKVRREERFESAGEAARALAEALGVPLPRPSDLDPAGDGAGSTGSSAAFERTDLALQTTMPIDPTPIVGTTRPATRSGKTSGAVASEARQVAAPRLARAVVLGALAGIVAITVFAVRWSVSSSREPSPALPAQSAAAVAVPSSVPEVLASAPSAALSPPPSAPSSAPPAAPSASVPPAAPRKAGAPSAPPPAPLAPSAAPHAKPPSSAPPKAADSCYKGGVFQSNNPECTEKP